MSTLSTIYLFYTPDLPPIFTKMSFDTDEAALEYGSHMISLRRIIKVTEYDETNPESGIMSFLSADSGPTNSTSPGSQKNPSSSGASSARSNLSTSISQLASSSNLSTSTSQLASSSGLPTSTSELASSSSAQFQEGKQDH